MSLDNRLISHRYGLGLGYLQKLRSPRLPRLQVLSFATRLHIVITLSDALFGTQNRIKQLLLYDKKWRKNIAEYQCIVKPDLTTTCEQRPPVNSSQIESSTTSVNLSFIRHLCQTPM
jgi:hypothetical protein